LILSFYELRRRTRTLAGFYDRLVGPILSQALRKKFASRIAYLFSRKRNLRGANRRENLYSGLLSLAPCSCVATRHVANHRSDVTGNALQRAISRWPARTTKTRVRNTESREPIEDPLRRGQAGFISSL